MKILPVSAFLVLALTGGAAAGNTPWHGYGGDAQHNATAPAQAQALSHIHWQMPVDLNPPGFLGVHYGEPMITAANTVLVPVKLDAAGTYRMEAHSGATGDKIWDLETGYRFPPYYWIPSIPAHLTEQNRLYFAGPGGTIHFRDQPDSATGDKGLAVFMPATSISALPSRAPIR